MPAPPDRKVRTASCDGGTRFEVDRDDHRGVQRDLGTIRRVEFAHPRVAVYVAAHHIAGPLVEVYESVVDAVEALVEFDDRGADAGSFR